MKKKNLTQKIVKNVKNSIKRTLINSAISSVVDAIAAKLVGNNKKKKAWKAKR